MELRASTKQVHYPLSDSPSLCQVFSNRNGLKPDHLRGSSGAEPDVPGDAQCPLSHKFPGLSEAGAQAPYLGGAAHRLAMHLSLS